MFGVQAGQAVLIDLASPAGNSRRRVETARRIAAKHRRCRYLPYRACTNRSTNVSFGMQGDSIASFVPFVGLSSDWAALTLFQPYVVTNPVRIDVE